MVKRRNIGDFDEFGVDRSNGAYRAAGDRVCERCGARFHSYQKTRRFCGRACTNEYKTKLGEYFCGHCGERFSPDHAGRKYCTLKCFSASRVKPKQIKFPSGRGRYSVECAGCGTEFKCPPSAGRKYCSYRCHIENGGAQRAGAASVAAKKKYGAKKDANHDEIFSVIRGITAARDLSSCGMGIPDGIAWVNGGWHLFDVKNPNTSYGKAGLNGKQKTWASDWTGGPVFLIYTEADALNFANGNFEEVKRFPEDRLAADLTAGVWR